MATLRILCRSSKSPYAKKFISKYIFLKEERIGAKLNHVFGFRFFECVCVYIKRIEFLTKIRVCPCYPGLVCK